MERNGCTYTPRTMSLGDIVDQLHDEHRLADTSTSEETNLASSLVGSEKIDDL